MIISVINNKGGVGKTVLTCNLSVALARQGKKTLVIDNDSQCNATSIILPNNNIQLSLYNLLDTDECSLKECIYSTNHKKLHCVPNIEQTSGLELEIAKRYPNSLQELRKKIRDYVNNNYDFCFIDNPPNMGVFVAQSLFASDCVIVPNDAGSANSLDGLRKALDLIDSIKEAGNPDLKFLRLLINKVDLRTSISQVIIDDINSHFSDNQIFKTMIPINTSIQQAEYAKKSVLEFASTSKAATSYRQLAREFLEIFKCQ